MRPRVRRRAAVVLSYAVYLALVWFHPWWVVRLFLVLLVTWLARRTDVQLKEALNPVAGRIVVGCVALMYVWSLWKNPLYGKSNGDRYLVVRVDYGMERVVVWPAC
jgi:hypothetical protein